MSSCSLAICHCIWTHLVLFESDCWYQALCKGLLQVPSRVRRLWVVSRGRPSWQDGGWKMFDYMQGASSSSIPACYSSIVLHVRLRLSYNLECTVFLAVRPISPLHLGRLEASQGGQQKASGPLSGILQYVTRLKAFLAFNFPVFLSCTSGQNFE